MIALCVLGWGLALLGWWAAWSFFQAAEVWKTRADESLREARRALGVAQRSNDLAEEFLYRIFSAGGGGFQ